MTTSSAAPVERATWTCRWLGDLKHRTWTLVSVSFSFHGVASFVQLGSYHCRDKRSRTIIATY